MFNPEKLLGALVQGALSEAGLSSRRSRRRSSYNSGASKAIGMGILGIGIAAFEHFTKGEAAVSVPPGGVMPPPAPTWSGMEGVTAVPPPPPGGAPQVAKRESEEALLLIRAMVSAASADGNIDDAERQIILDRLAEAELTAEERSFLAAEMSNPQSADTIAASVANQDIAEQVYAASLLAITVDTDEELRHMKTLIVKLGLSAETVAKWHRLLGVPPLG